jgi:hypothetical protein
LKQFKKEITTMKPIRLFSPFAEKRVQIWTQFGDDRLSTRRLNGYEAPEWRALRFCSDAYAIQHVKLYCYH